MKIAATEIVSAPVQRVFAVFTDIANAPQRIKGIQRVEILSSETSGIGLRWRETRTMFGKEATEEMEITQMESLKYYVVEARSHGMHYITRFSFASVHDGAATRVDWEFVGIPMTLVAKLMAPIGWLFKDATEKLMKQDLLDLKAFLEAPAART